MTRARRWVHPTKRENLVNNVANYQQELDLLEPEINPHAIQKDIDVEDVFQKKAFETALYRHMCYSTT
ncbi:hypothetical protein AMTRI_Chr04g247150 [Amborella trichopoda]